MKKSLFPIAYRRCGMSIGFFLQFISVFLFSQTFNKNNPEVNIQNGVIFYTTDDFSSEIKDSTSPEAKISTGKAEIYIAKDIHIYGVEHFGNSTFNREKAIACRPEKRKADVKPKDQKVQLYKSEKKTPATSFISSSESSRTFFALSEGYLGFAVLNNNPVIQKFQIAYEDLYVSAYSFTKEAIIIFSARSSSPVKEEVLAHYSRPPPFIMFFKV
ncbi:hypothetical protein [Chryseobacterium sp. IT-36CA2]|uniref:hypothetical protein n=1 Tax=Chryseobacterium sp. IT-36CA2 TaxID=3026460 RepID=UPI0039E0C2CA